MRLLILVVIYKVDILECETIRSILIDRKLIDNVEVLIWDNSPSAVSKSSLQHLIDKGLKYTYQSTPENLPLSVIYNRALAIANNRILILFDQDSTVDIKYIGKIREILTFNSGYHLAVPYIMQNGVCVSPGYFSLYKGKYFKVKPLGKVSSRNVIAVTSGMALWVDANLNVKFDQNLKFYGVDTKFCLDYGNSHKYIYVVDYELKHNMSQFQAEPHNVKKVRFKKYMTSSLYILKSRGAVPFIIGCVIWNVKGVLFKLFPKIFKNKI